MSAGACRMVAAVAMLLITSLPAVAQIPASELPGRERDRFVQPQAPRAQPSGTVISLPSTVAPPGAESVKVRVRRVRVTGSTVYGALDFAPLYDDIVGREVALTAIYEIAQRITTKYGNDGYVLSRAIVPPQELTPGGAEIRIQVVEGYIDKVEWPASLSRYRDFFSDYTAKILASRPTNVKVLERYLLLAADLPGLKFKNSLKPSTSAQGAATLVVEVEEKPIDYNGRVDNRGTKARGPWQHFNSVTVNNLTRGHESWTASYAAATQSKELRYGVIGYRQVLTSEGLTVFANQSFSRSKPGTALLELLEYETKGRSTEAGISYPVIRQRERNLIVTALLFATNDQSDILQTLNTLDRLRGVRARMESDLADPLGGINQFNAVASQGFDGLDSTKNGSLFASRANGRVDFTKLEGTYVRTQPLMANVSLLVAAYAQYARTPLLAPELCGYGGRAFGRAFNPSELVGDSCVQVLGELRYDIPHGLQGVTQLQLYGFADRGWLHNIAPVAGTPANLDSASAGGGFRFGLQPRMTVDLSAAKGIVGLRDEWRYFLIATGRY